MNVRHQAGFTLTELLVSMGLSLGLIAAVLTSYVGTFTHSMATLDASRLNHEMNSLMGLMSNDIRRAGYWGSLDVNEDPIANPFHQTGQTTLTVYNSMANNTAVGSTGNGSCIVFAYDMNGDGEVDPEELTGFRLNNGVVQVRVSGTPGTAASCASLGDVWEDLTDARLVTVTGLNFDLAGSACINIEDADALDCYAVAPAAGDMTVETREVRITLEGALTEDDFVRFTQTHTVRVRNELIREF